MLYRFNASNFIKIQFSSHRQNNPKIYMETQKIHNSQRDPKCVCRGGGMLEAS